jgi:uncharacterized protein YqgV (UPF0045/DUF77 family)
MSVIARFEVIPVRDGSMSTAIACALRALDRHPVTYRTTATDTIVEADSVETVFAAIEDAHRAIPEDRVITSLEIDEDRRRHQDLDERVAAVERELGHPAERRQPPVQRTGRGGPAAPTQHGMQRSQQPSSAPRRGGGRTQPLGSRSQEREQQLPPIH